MTPRIIVSRRKVIFACGNREDILKNMLQGNSLGDILTVTDDLREKGFIYEIVINILLACRSFVRLRDGMAYALMNCGIPTYADTTPYRRMHDICGSRKKLASGGDGGVDFIIRFNDGKIWIGSVKHQGKTIDEVHTMRMITAAAEHNKSLPPWTICSISIDGHVGKKKHRELATKDMVQGAELLTKEDVHAALQVFQSTYSFKTMDTLKNFYERVNKEVFGCELMTLLPYVHQEMTSNKIALSPNKGRYRHLLAHKCRSGKSITALMSIKKLRDRGTHLKCGRALIITPVVSTLKGYQNDLGNYRCFKDLSYKKQDEFASLNKNFKGIFMCSIQFLKMDKSHKKEKLLYGLGFDMVIVDESHEGSSTEKTERKIIGNLLKKYPKTLFIFASGTPEKTRWFYNIPPTCVYSWDIEDEACMKDLNEANMGQMEERHGPEFRAALVAPGINCDYMKFPSRVLIGATLSPELAVLIKKYNEEQNIAIPFGWTCHDIFQLCVEKEEMPDGQTEKRYLSKFMVAETQMGQETLKAFFKSIIDEDDPNRKEETIMSLVEKTQAKYGSRQSEKARPQMFIVYMPHVGSIKAVQEATVQFLLKHKLWREYNILYSSCYANNLNLAPRTTIDDDFVEMAMLDTKNKKKKGCILLLGRQGSLGITYPKCDVTISLDNGKSCDLQKQREYRALTPALGKTIGINVDLNRARTYNTVVDAILRYKRETGCTGSYGEVLLLLMTKKTFIFNPHKTGFGLEMDSSDLLEGELARYRTFATEENILEQLSCKKYAFINENISLRPSTFENSVEPDPLAPGVKVTLIGKNKKKIKLQIEKEDRDEIWRINKTNMLLKILIPTACFLMRMWNIDNIATIFQDKESKEFLFKWMETKINISGKGNRERTTLVGILMKEFDSNQDIVNRMIELYRTASAKKVRILISKHIPTTPEEMKKWAEISTSPILVDEQFHTLPDTFYERPQKFIDLCVGKGAYVLGVFDRFWEGLKVSIVDEIERCRVIVEECLYFADINPFNIKLTKMFLKLHSQQYCGLGLDIDYKFNAFEGDAMELDSYKEWGIRQFDCGAMNPPFEKVHSTTGKKIGGGGLAPIFINKLFSLIKKDGYMSVISPYTWLGPSTNKQSGGDILHRIVLAHDIIHLNITECKQHFKGVGSSFCYFTLRKSYDPKLLTNVVSTLKTNISPTREVINLKDYKELPYFPIHITTTNLKLVQEVTAPGPKLKIGRTRKLDTSTKKKKVLLSDKKTDIFKYLTYHTTTRTKWSSTKVNDPANGYYYGKWKVVLNMSGYLKPVVCKNCNVTESKYYVPVTSEQEGIRLRDYLETERLKDYLKLCKYSGYNSRPVLASISYT